MPPEKGSIFYQIIILNKINIIIAKNHKLSAK